MLDAAHMGGMATAVGERQERAAAWPQDQWWAHYNDAQLNALVDEALAGSPSLAQASARVREALGAAQQAGAALKPAVNANISLSETRQSYYNGVPLEAVPKGWNEAASTTLDLSYELDFFGKNRAALAAARGDVAAAMADQAQARLTLTSAVVNAYAELAGAIDELDLARSTVDVRQQTAALVGRRQQAGLETDAALYQATSTLETAKASAEVAEEDVLLKRYQLAALLGAGPERGLDIGRPTLGARAVVGLPDNVPAELMARRPDLTAARLRAEAEAKRVDVAKAGFYPNVNLVGSIGKKVLGLGYFDEPDARAGSLGPVISLPIFQGGRIKGQFRSARASYDGAVSSYNDTLLEALRQVASAMASKQSFVEQYRRTVLAREAAEHSYEMVELRYRGGLSSYLDVLTAENTLINTRVSESRYQTRAITLDVSLAKALGGGYLFEKNKK